MSPLRFRPEIRLPWQALALLAAAAYVVRSALRGWDFRPSLLDALVWGGLAAILIARGLLAASIERDSDGPDEDD